MRAKLGLATEEPDDRTLIEDLLQLMAQERTDYTIAWRRLCDFRLDDDSRNTAVRDLFIDRAAFDAWAVRYRER
ncbi:hypothetical protein OFB74_31925, partial [Escherichia coli]|nr:hypothetical protein [Escherichia coli]